MNTGNPCCEWFPCDDSAVKHVRFGQEVLDVADSPCGSSHMPLFHYNLCDTHLDKVLLDSRWSTDTILASVHKVVINTSKDKEGVTGAHSAGRHRYCNQPSCFSQCECKAPSIGIMPAVASLVA